MKQVSGKALAKAIERKGWSLVRVKGSHHIFVMSGRRVVGLRRPNKALAVAGGMPPLLHVGCAWPATTEAHR